MKKEIKQSEDETSMQAPEQIAKRCYSNYKESNDLAFDPMKELNLPSSSIRYKETVLWKL